MAGPSPWRLPSPQRGPDIGHSIWVHDRACWLNNSSPRSLSTILRGPDTSSSCVTRNRHAKPPGVDMNLTLVAAIVLLLLWGVVVFVAHNGSGPVQLLYAVAVVLFARRIIAGAPKFVS